MPKKGLKRYLQLLKNIKNFTEYIFNANKRYHRSLTFITKPNAIKFQVPESLYQVFKEIFMADVYHINTLTKKIPTNSTIIDIGANAGFFDILILSKLSNATIYAYEPLESNVTLLQETINTNRNISKKISIYQKGVTGAALPFLELFAEDTTDNSVVASTFANFNKLNTKKIIVPCITLTEIINDCKTEKIDLLKLDCEGSEYDILYNTPSTLLQKINFLSIEVHDLDTDKNNLQALNKYLISLGYKTSYSPINNFCYAFEAEK